MSGQEPWTVLKLINWTKDYLAKAGVEDARLCAELMLAHVLGCRRIELYTRFDHVPSADQLSAFKALVQRAAKHEPAAYLLGEKEFYSLLFQVTPAVLIPRSETELLVSAAIEFFRTLGRTGRMWDACTGSGCVAVATAANVPKLQVLATDISQEAIEVAQKNVERHKLADRVICRQADLLSWPQDAPAELAPPFDVITANPPYVAKGEVVGESTHHEPHQALYAEQGGLELIERIVQEAPQKLASGGQLIMEFGYKHADAVRDLILATGEFSEPRILQDHQDIERVAVATRK